MMGASINRSVTKPRYFSSIIGPGLSLSPKQVGKVRNALFGAPALMYLNYATIPNNETISDIHDYTFKPIRITTSAIGNLSRKLFTTGIEGLLS